MNVAWGGNRKFRFSGALFLWSLRVLPLSVWGFFIEFWCPPSVRCIPISLKLPVTRVTFRCITASLTTRCRTWIGIKDSNKQMSDVNKSFIVLKDHADTTNQIREIVFAVRQQLMVPWISKPFLKVTLSWNVPCKIFCSATCTRRLCVLQKG